MNLALTLALTEPHQQQIAAIVIASLLALLALLLVGYRYYRRRSRANSRRISGLSAWAGQRQSQAGGWDSGEDRWGKQEEGVGKWEGGEKERVSPVSLTSPERSVRVID